jgi:YwqJ-like deaminase
VTVTTTISARQENHGPDLVSSVNTPHLDYGWIPASHLKPGMHLKTPDGRSAVVVGGSVPAVHDGWMWDLTVPGNNDHDFYVGAHATYVLVHNVDDPQCDLAQQASSLADRQVRPPGEGDPRTVAVLRTLSGGTYEGVSGSGVAPADSVQEALDSVPEDIRPGFHGECAEIQCISQAVQAEDPVEGGDMAAARVRGPNSPAHGTPIEPCASCAWVMGRFGIG